LLEEDPGRLEELFIVSRVEISGGRAEEPFQSAEIPGLRIWVEPARGAKCSRCWKWEENLGQDPAHPEACPRCTGILSRLKG